MNDQRPHFEKKELALSSSPYVYLPVDIPVYTVEVSHREESTAICSSASWTAPSRGCPI